MIGVGQSMGGHIVIATQVYHGSFDAVGALGSSFTQTRSLLRPGARHPIRNVARDELFAAFFADGDTRATRHWPDEPPALVAADMSPAIDAPWHSRAVPGWARELLLPAVLAREAAAVRVPVFLGYGEADVTPDPVGDVAMFRSSCDIRLAIIPAMAHMDNFAASRAELRRRREALIGEVRELETARSVRAEAARSPEA